MKAYFDLPRIGKLEIEHRFYELDGEPILFVCKDPDGVRYLCSCCLMYEKWVIARTEEAALSDLIEDQITIRDVFESRGSSVISVSWDGKEFSVDAAASSELFPQVGAKLELPHERNGPYHNMLRREALLAAWARASRFDELTLRVSIRFSPSYPRKAPLDSMIPAPTGFAAHIKISTSEPMKRLADIEFSPVPGAPTQTPKKPAREAVSLGSVPRIDFNSYAA